MWVRLFNSGRTNAHDKVRIDHLLRIETPSSKQQSIEWKHPDGGSFPYAKSCAAYSGREMESYVWISHRETKPLLSLLTVQFWKICICHSKFDTLFAYWWCHLNCTTIPGHFPLVWLNNSSGPSIGKNLIIRSTALIFCHINFIRSSSWRDYWEFWWQRERHHLWYWHTNLASLYDKCLNTLGD